MKWIDQMSPMRAMQAMDCALCSCANGIASLTVIAICNLLNGLFSGYACRIFTLAVLPSQLF